MFSDGLSEFTALFGRAFDWAVPGLALSVPGMVLILAIAAQAAGALAWLPLVRRRIGGFGSGPGPRQPEADPVQLSDTPRLDGSRRTDPYSANITNSGL